MTQKHNNFLKLLKDGNYELFYKLFSNYNVSKNKKLLLEFIDFIQYCSLAYNHKVNQLQYI
jgi:hypothetical protein